MVWFRRTRNLKRRIFRKPIGFVHLALDGDLPAVREPVPFIQKQVFDQPDFSILELREYSRRIIDSNKASGLLIQLGNLKGGNATLDSVIDLIRMWQDENLPVWIYSNSYSFMDYYLASHADRVFIARGGSLNTTGLSMTSSFFHDYFKDKGIEMQVAQVTKYKSAFNSFAYDEMPEEQRENLNWLADGIFSTVVSAISENRAISREKVEAMIDTAPIPDIEAKELSYIDDIGTATYIANIIEENFDVELIELKEAVGRLPIPKKGKPNIAIIPVIGSIVDGESKKNPLPIPIIGGRQSGDWTISQYVRLVREKDNFKAAVLLVNSPGGSATASESMLQELSELAKKIPLVVYFHDVAASGGYYISMASSEIIGQPLTITASIGVVNAKISTDEFYNKRGIHRVTIKRGENSTIEGTTGSWNEDQRDVIEKNMNRIYEVFKNYVSDNRNLDMDSVDQVAGGRVYLGFQGKNHELLDNLGGIEIAIDRAAELADIDKPAVEVIGDQKKIRAPDNLMEPDVFAKELAKVSGKSQLLPYFSIENQLEL